MNDIGDLINEYQLQTSLNPRPRCLSHQKMLAMCVPGRNLRDLPMIRSPGQATNWDTRAAAQNDLSGLNPWLQWEFQDPKNGYLGGIWYMPWNLGINGRHLQVGFWEWSLMVQHHLDWRYLSTSELNNGYSFNTCMMVMMGCRTSG